MTTTIGALTNVPNPGSPITSPWAQDVTRFARHQFATAASLLAQWPSAPNGSHAILLDTGARVERFGGQWTYVDPVAGTQAGSISSANVATITVSWGVTFLAAPVAVATVVAGGNTDLIGCWSGGLSTTGGPMRVVQNTGANVTVSFTVNWVAFGRRAV